VIELDHGRLDAATVELGGRGAVPRLGQRDEFSDG
jgi:hypothetical protein